MTISQIGAAGMNAAGTIAVTKIASDVMHRSTKGLRKTKTQRVSRLPKSKRKIRLTKGKGLFK